jgi:hypothetical protein
VSVFDLTGHPTATRAYAFAIENDGQRRIAAVLHRAPVVDSPHAAVRAAIVAKRRERRVR